MIFHEHVRTDRHATVSGSALGLTPFDERNVMAFLRCGRALSCHVAAIYGDSFSCDVILEDGRRARCEVGRSFGAYNRTVTIDRRVLSLTTAELARLAATAQTVGEENMYRRELERRFTPAMNAAGLREREFASHRWYVKEDGTRWDGVVVVCDGVRVRVSHRAYPVGDRLVYEAGPRSDDPK